MFLAPNAHPSSCLKVSLHATTKAGGHNPFLLLLILWYHGVTLSSHSQHKHIHTPNYHIAREHVPLHLPEGTCRQAVHYSKNPSLNLGVP